MIKGPSSETIPRLRAYLDDRKTSLFAVVGDVASENILESGLEPDIVVVDHRVMRKDIDPIDLGERHQIRSRNLPGTVDVDAWAALEKAITLKSKASVIVEGEEDLLVLPLISLMPLGSIIVYGQPRQGMVVVEVTKKMKGWAEEFLSRMEMR